MNSENPDAPSSIGECGPEPIQLLEKAGLDVRLNSSGHGLALEDVIALGKDCVGIIAGLKRLDDATLVQFPNRCVVSRLAAGVENPMDNFVGCLHRILEIVPMVMRRRET